ncbi:MAG: ankyrin repeat domain-containing protein [Solirubrobacterales bacterium]
MIKPDELRSELPHGPWGCRGCDVWDAIWAAAAGDAEGLRRLLERDPNLYRAEYWYTQPIHFAVREGHLEATRVLLDAGADPAAARLGEDLVTVARDRGHKAVAELLEERSTRRGRARPVESDHPFHVAADAGDAARVRALLDAEPGLVHRSDRAGGTPLHRAVAASAREVVGLLLDRGADIHAIHGPGPGSESGYAAADFQAIDLALWTGPFWGVRGDLETARQLIARGAAHDLVIAAALGDLELVQALLDADHGRIAEARPSGKRALSSAVEFGHEQIVRLLLDRGADPNWPDGSTAPRGAALHAAARGGHLALVEVLLAHGADPNGSIDSAGSATYAARTRELRALLLARGGALDAYDLVWLGEDDEAVRRVSADPGSANEGCGGVLAAACTLGKRDLLVRLLDAGARVPPVLTACRSYLLEDPEMLRLLLASGMSPDLPNWRMATPLHDLCGRDARGRPMLHRTECAAILLDAGATISARDEDYRSTPLAWAARNDLPDMVELLLARGAAPTLPGDEPWATPLAWATRRGHGGIGEILRRAGATS